MGKAVRDFLDVVRDKHHVEEVPDGFTHAMLLRRGSLLAAGPIDEVFTARNLSRCFGVPLEIEYRKARWAAWAAR